MTSISALWIGGRLSPYETLSLKSFLDYGHEVDLYTYDSQLDAPEGIVLRDANEVVNARSVFENPNHKGTWAGFSNIFRYELLRSRPTIWVDTDVVALGPKISSTHGFVFGWESPEYLNGAVLGGPMGSDFTERLVDEALQIDRHTFQWGDLGPKLVTRVVHELGLESYAQRQHAFYPIGFRDVWMLFDPESREDVEAAVSGSEVLHWWNEALRRAPSNVKEFLPPKGSFFAALFEEHGALSPEMPRLQDDWSRQKWKKRIQQGPSLPERLWGRITGRSKPS